MAGTPAGVDPDYQRRHPAWRESYHQMQRDILLQYRYDREAGKRIQVEDDRWIPSSGLSLDELQLLSERRARQILERCIRRREDVGAARTRQVTTAARGQVV